MTSPDAYVDRSREAQHGDIVIAALNTEPLCKRLHKCGGKLILMSENKGYRPGTSWKATS